MALTWLSPSVQLQPLGLADYGNDPCPARLWDATATLVTTARVYEYESEVQAQRELSLTPPQSRTRRIASRSPFGIPLTDTELSIKQSIGTQLRMTAATIWTGYSQSMSNNLPFRERTCVAARPPVAKRCSRWHGPGDCQTWPYCVNATKPCRFVHTAQRTDTELSGIFPLRPCTFPGQNSWAASATSRGRPRSAGWSNGSAGSSRRGHQRRF